MFFLDGNHAAQLSPVNFEFRHVQSQRSSKNERDEGAVDEGRDLIGRTIGKLKVCQLGHPLFFFVYCLMRFLVLGRSVGKRKQKSKNKIGKLAGARRPGTSVSSSVAGMKTTRCGYKVTDGGNGAR